MEKDIHQLFADTSLGTRVSAKRPSHWILWLSVVFILISIAYLSFTKIDEVTKAQGRVIPSKQIQVLQNLEGGIIQSINIQEGQKVKKGQLLMTIDDTRFSSAYLEGKTKEKALRLKVERLRAEANGQGFQPPSDLMKKYPDMVSSEVALHLSLESHLVNQISIINDQKIQKQQELMEAKAKKTKLDKSYQLIKRELAIIEPLMKEGVASKVEVIRLQRQENDIQGELSAIQAIIPKAEKAVSEADKKIQQVKLKFKSQALENLTKATAEWHQTEENNKLLEDRFNRTLVKSPVDGTVKQVYMTTLGGVIKPGKELVEIVPDDDTLLIDAKVKPADIAFIHLGQEAMVKLTAYDFSIYGGLPAKVERISADTIKDDNNESFYEIQVRTTQNYLNYQGEILPIMPGMMASVDILTGEKSIMDYILKPIIKTKQGALGER